MVDSDIRDRRSAAAARLPVTSKAILLAAEGRNVDSKSRPRRGRRGRQDLLHLRQSRQRRCSRESQRRGRGLDRHVLRRQRGLQRINVCSDVVDFAEVAVAPSTTPVRRGRGALLRRRGPSDWLRASASPLTIGPVVATLVLVPVSQRRTDSRRRRSWRAGAWIQR